MAEMKINGQYNISVISLSENIHLLIWLRRQSANGENIQRNISVGQLSVMAVIWLAIQ